MRHFSSAAKFAAPLLILSLLFFAGCGPPTGTINGVIKKGDEPLPFARMEIRPKGEGRSFRGESVNDGKYYLDAVAAEGMPPGQYNAIISYYTLRNGDPLPEGEEGESLKGTNRAKEHKVVVEFELKPGGQNLDFDVAQGKPQE